MDDLQAEEQAINARAEENSQLESPTSEQTTPEVSDESVQPETTEKSTEGEETEGRKVNGAEKRIHHLVDERDQYKKQAEDLSSRLEELTSQSDTKGGYPGYIPDESGERELTIDDLRAITRLEIEKERTVSRINQEAREVQKFYPELDKTSDAFDPDVNEAVTTAVWLEIQKDPSKSVTKLTDKYMKPYLKAAERAAGQEKRELVKQVHDEALRPSAIKATDRKFHEKSIAEMERELETVW
jgi:hypothetical protein